jgi:hypothetical protein
VWLAVAPQFQAAELTALIGVHDLGFAVTGDRLPHRNHAEVDLKGVVQAALDVAFDHPLVGRLIPRAIDLAHAPGPQGHPDVH